MGHNYQTKMLKEILPHFTKLAMMYYNIVPAVFSYFFKDSKYVVCSFVYDRISIIQFFPLQSRTWPFSHLF